VERWNYVFIFSLLLLVYTVDMKSENKLVKSPNFLKKLKMNKSGKKSLTPIQWKERAKMVEMEGSSACVNQWMSFVTELRIRLMIHKVRLHNTQYSLTTSSNQDAVAAFTKR